MQRFYGELRDSSGQIRPGISVSVYAAGTGNLVPLFLASDPDKVSKSEIVNPLITDAYGRYSFAVPNGTYDIKVTGQTTIPVIASQGARDGSEDVSAWKKLAGITK